MLLRGSNLNQSGAQLITPNVSKFYASALTEVLTDFPDIDGDVTFNSKTGVITIESGSKVINIESASKVYTITG